MAQLHLLSIPVAHAGGVDFAEDGGIIGITLQQAAIGRLTQRGIGSGDVAPKLAARQLDLLAVHDQAIGVAARQHIVEREQFVETVDILDVDDPLLRLGKRVRLEAPQPLQEVASVPADGHQPLGGLVLQPLPPEGEEERPVFRLCDELLRLCLEAQSLLVALILGEVEMGVGLQAHHIGGKRLVLVEERDEIRLR